MNKINGYLLFVLLIIIVGVFKKLIATESGFQGVVVKASCEAFGKSDIGLRIIVKNESKIENSFILPPKNQLCRDIIKNDLEGKAVKVSYSSIYGYFVSTEKYEFESGRRINSNRY